jgi:hypothetical protein
MQQKIRQVIFNGIIMTLILSACSLQATPTAPPVDIAGTIAVQLASQMLTQTVAAYSPTPPPTPSATPTIELTATPSVPAGTSIPMVVALPGSDAVSCYAGPNTSGPLTSHINTPKKVEFLGVGSVPGWYVIRNPYFRSPCWIKVENLQLGSDFDISAYPTIKP